jgi:hypothetical protein
MGVTSASTRLAEPAIGGGSRTRASTGLTIAAISSLGAGAFLGDGYYASEDATEPAELIRGATI